VLDRATVMALAGLLGLLAWVVVAGAGPSAHAFWQTSSIAFVVGGSVLAGLLASPAVGLRRLVAIVRSAFVVRGIAPEETIITLVALAEIARRDGLLAMEKPVGGLRDDFTRRAAQMAIDGTDRDVIQAVMQAELESIDLRHAEGKAALESMARFSPAFGMMGTVIGLVIMLGRMDDPSHIGPGMAVALLTTLYGLAFANLFCLPLARRLTYRSSQELLAKTVALKGVLGIQAGDNPRVLAQKLRAHLPGAGQGQEFAWSTPTRRGARLQDSIAEFAPTASQAANREAPPAPVIPAKPAIDEETAKALAAKLEKLAGRGKRLVDAA
jgi:chemotaxis protein MotA